MATLNIKNFPDLLYEALQKQAEREHRSIAQQVIHLLARAAERPEPLSILALRGLGKELWQGLEAGDHVQAERDAWDS